MGNIVKRKFKTMNMKKYAAFVAAVMIAMTGMAQTNLVPNGDFETTVKKPRKGAGEIELAEPWISPGDENKADLYSKDIKKEYGIPENVHGYMQIDDEGKNYAGIRVFAYRDAMPRTYLQVKLAKPLVAGKKYCVKFKVALSKLSKYASNNIGMYISEKKPRERDILTYTLKPQIRNARNKVYNDQFLWDEVCGVYEATGNERYITIGNFVSNDDMKDKRDYLRMKRPRGYTTQQTADAYYYIDDVSIINLEELEVCDCDKDASGSSMKVVYHEDTSEGMDISIDEQIALVSVFFNSNSTTPSSPAGVTKIIELLEKNPDVKVQIIGHMDKREDKENLNDLSVERAKAIYDYLIKRGIPAERLSYKGVKSSQPADDSGTPDSLAKNRRVEFRVVH